MDADLKRKIDFVLSAVKDQLHSQWSGKTPSTGQRFTHTIPNSHFSEELKAELDALRPFPQGSLRSLKEKIALEWTFHFNAIEGNTLTLRETKVVLEGITVGGKTMREHFEAISHSHAIEYVGEIASNKEPLSEWQIKSLHSLVLRNVDDSNAGRYRNEGVAILGASFNPPEPIRLPEEMEKLLKWYEASQHVHPVLLAAELHTRFVKIHPFIDGNGRTARLLMNLELIKKGHLPAVIRKDDRVRYYDSLDEACVTGDFTKIQALVAEAACRSSLTYLSILKPDRYRDYQSN